MDLSKIDWRYLYTSFEGRIPRSDYWIAAIAMGVVSLIVQMVIGAISTALAALVSLVFLYPAYALMVKRGHDRDRPDVIAQAFIGAIALMTIIALVPFLNLLALPLSFIVLIAAIALFVDYGLMPGTPGPNRFGPQPGRMILPLIQGASR
jgi:uncharacterized membrane protein YhaH (DUF805 family)